MDAIQAKARQLDCLIRNVTLRQWLAVKAHPVRDVLTFWRNVGYGAEVVSPFELEAALETGYPTDRILVNGVAKHHWLKRYQLRNLSVHFDSVAEIEALADHAVEHQWRVGLRYHPTMQKDPDEPQFHDQFGLSAAEMEVAVSSLRGIEIEGVHFHLRSNIRHPTVYETALVETFDICRKLAIRPTYVDCGGGLPIEDEVPIWEETDSEPFDLVEYVRILESIPSQCPSVKEVWVENGRFITSESTVLVSRVLDVKERNGMRYLICDGGRTNHALVSDWQCHPVLSVPARSGTLCNATICGPTCMAFDRLRRMQLPAAIRPDDLIIWMNAGAYHIPWETRFSFGLPAVITVSKDGTCHLARMADSFMDWWGRWTEGCHQ